MYVRKRNTTSKIKDVERLVLEGIESITPEAWANCVRHVREQEEYFWECDSQFEAYQNEELEEIEFGSLEEILAPDVASFKFQNPSTSRCPLTILHNMQSLVIQF